MHIQFFSTTFAVPDAGFQEVISRDIKTVTRK
jgi:hypothetical protein